jgi:hypothetical protein
MERALILVQQRELERYREYSTLWVEFLEGCTSNSYTWIKIDDRDVIGGCICSECVTVSYREDTYTGSETVCKIMKMLGLPSGSYVRLACEYTPRMTIEITDHVEVSSIRVNMPLSDTIALKIFQQLINLSKKN